VTAVAITADGERAVSTALDRTLRAWNLATGKTVAIFWADAPLTACAVARDGATVFAGDSSRARTFASVGKLT
jgi:WD40 repeat protein